jgi:activator of HSP90 ATPase
VGAQVTITLEEPEKGTTVLRLEQTGIPLMDRFGNEDVLQTTETGWHNQIVDRIRKVFGYGA